MKKIKTPLLTLLLTVTALCAAGQGMVTVYSNDFNGADAELGVGKYDYMTLLRAGVSVVRSVKVPAGMQVTLYEKDNFEGTSLVLLQDANLKLIEGKGFGKISQNVSLIVAKAPESVLNQPVVTIYRDNFSGASLALREGYYDHYALGGVENDKLSSVKVPKGMKVTLYEHGGYKGRSLVITQDVNADFLIKNKFNDITSSIRIEVLPEPVKEIPKEVPGDPTPVVVVVPVVAADEKDDPVFPKATIFDGNYSGASKKLGAGRYDAAAMGIGDNALSSIKVPAGLRVVLYDQPNFKGKSLVLKDEDAPAGYFEAHAFDNVVSSMVVELVPRISIYPENFAGSVRSFEPGYYYTGDLEIGNDELSSVKVLKGVWALLFEDNNFQGRSLLITQDASEDFMAGKDFNDLTSSMIVGSIDTPLPVVTLFDGDREDSFKKLTPGEYPLLDVGNNMLSSVEIPRGLKVTLFENAGYEGRSMEITKSVGTDFMKKYEFDNLTSSVIIEQRDPRDLVVQIYSGSYKGFSQDLTPGEYHARDIEIGTKDLTSLKVPRGMQVELYANDDLTGVMGFADRDTDLTGSNMFDNYYSSLRVKDIHQPRVTPVAAPSSPPVEVPAPVQDPVEVAPAVVYSYDPPCTMNDDQFQNAMRSIESKPFSDEKMEMVMLVTKDKCLTNDQIRAIAREFDFEEQTLEFVKYAYDNATQKDTYYLLEDVFKFMSSKDGFRKFLKGK
jgi:hypothetical protein